MCDSFRSRQFEVLEHTAFARFCAARGAVNLSGPIILISGVAQLAVNTLVAGVHSITAVYFGDTNNQVSTSPGFNQTVTGVSVNVSSAAVQVEQPVTLTATVVGAAPTGSVQFKVNGANFGAAVTLVNGVATLVTSSLPEGSDLITAAYLGDANNAVVAADLPGGIVVASSDGSGDVPLPAWALALLGAGLARGLWRSRRGASGAVS